MSALKIGDPRLPARFWRQVQQDTATTCWAWIGNKTRGYGQIHWRGKSVYSHRLAYEALVGPIPDGLYIDHLCRRPDCVNPAHLEAVTNQENILRGVGPTAVNKRKTHCKNGHEFTPENTTHRGIGNARGCRRCTSASNKRQRERRKAKASAT